MEPNEPVEAVESAAAPAGPNRPVAPTFPGGFDFRAGTEVEKRKIPAAAMFVGTAVLATLGWTTVYLVAFGPGDAVASPDRAVAVGLTPGATADQPASATAAKKVSVAAKARVAAKALPKGKLNDNEKRLALKKYTDAIGLDLSTTASPASAARSACRLLGTGTEPEDLVVGIAKGGKISKPESRAFLLGATSLYCPTETKPFRR